jgi:hypothetical protein
LILVNDVVLTGSQFNAWLGETPVPGEFVVFVQDNVMLLLDMLVSGLIIRSVKRRRLPLSLSLPDLIRQSPRLLQTGGILALADGSVGLVEMPVNRRGDQVRA